MIVVSISDKLGFLPLRGIVIVLEKLQGLMLRMLFYAGTKLGEKMTAMIPRKEIAQKRLFGLDALVLGEKKETVLPLLHYVGRMVLFRSLDGTKTSEVFLIKSCEVTALGYSIAPPEVQKLSETLNHISHYTNGFIRVYAIDTDTYREQGYVSVHLGWDTSKKLPDIIL